MRTRSLLRPRVAAVLALEDSAILGYVVYVHDFRVATRSLRAALLTIARRRHDRLVQKARRTLQTATQVLADSRDRDVGRSLLSKIVADTPRSLAIKRRLLALSDRDRQTAHLACLENWPRNLDRQLIELLEKRERGVDSVIRRARAESWRQRRQAIDILESLGRKYDAVLLHDLRRRVRSLRYAIEVLAEVDSSASARVTQLKPLQSVLGDIQDRNVLSLWLRRTASRFGRSEPSLARALRREADRFRQQSMKAHARFLRLGPRRILERLALHVDASSDFPHAVKKKKV